MVNSRAKGCRGERMWRDELREAGFTARRGQQFAGGTDSPDVICEELKNLHMEVKCVQALNLALWMAQVPSHSSRRRTAAAAARHSAPQDLLRFMNVWVQFVLMVRALARRAGCRRSVPGPPVQWSWRPRTRRH